MRRDDASTAGGTRPDSKTLLTKGLYEWRNRGDDQRDIKSKGVTRGQFFPVMATIMLTTLLR
jgi:hypothetical protein